MEEKSSHRRLLLSYLLKHLINVARSHMLLPHLDNVGAGESVSHSHHDVLAERRGARADAPERAEVVPAAPAVLGERDHRRRRAEDVRDAVALDGGEHGVDVEPGHDDDGVAALQLAEGDHGHAEDVEHGQEAEEHVAASFPELVLVRRHHRRRRDEVAVREHHALALPGRARRVEQRRRVALPHGRRAAVLRLLNPGDEVRVESDVTASAGAVRTKHGGAAAVAVEEDGGEAEAGDLGQEVGDSDDELGAGVGRLLGDLPRGVARVSRGGDGAERGDREEADRVEHAVGREEQHGVAAADASAGGERGGRDEHRGPEGPEGERAAGRGVHERRRGGARRGAAQDEVREGEARVRGDLRRRARRAVHAVGAVARGRRRRARHSCVDSSCSCSCSPTRYLAAATCRSLALNRVPECWERALSLYIFLSLFFNVLGRGLCLA